jgi:hypothetical protein
VLGELWALRVGFGSGFRGPGGLVTGCSEDSWHVPADSFTNPYRCMYVLYTPMGICVSI